MATVTERGWLRANGYPQLSDRGRVPAEAHNAWLAYTGQEPEPAPARSTTAARALTSTRSVRATGRQRAPAAPLTPEQQRAELHRSTWKIANDMRATAMDNSEFKYYVLGILFYRYISENLERDINAEYQHDDPDFDYAKLSDAEASAVHDEIVHQFGYFIAPSQLFSNLVRRCDTDENLNETLSQVLRAIETSTLGHTDAARQFSGLFNNINPNDNRLGTRVGERNIELRNLLHGVAEINLGAVAGHQVDAFGDIYEFLMTKYAEKGGEAGEFFTPQDVSRLLTLIALDGRRRVNKVYDPTCGSGSLLLQSAQILGQQNVMRGFFGQELKKNNFDLCRMNMFVHGIDYDKFDIQQGDTLVNPKHWDDEPFEVIVANPPFSQNWPGRSDPALITDPRFSPAGALAPEKKKADLAFVMHCAAWLAEAGVAAMVTFPGALYRTGDAEVKIRKYLVDANLVDAVIQLPGKMFFNTSISACILVLKRGKQTHDIAFIDATAQCVPVTKSNQMREEDLQQVLGWLRARTDVPHLVTVVPNDQIGEKCDLSVSTYVQAADTREVVELPALINRLTQELALVNATAAKIEPIARQIAGLPNEVVEGYGECDASVVEADAQHQGLETTTTNGSP